MSSQLLHSLLMCILWFVWLVLRSAVGMTHDLRSDLWWTIPFRILLGQFRDTLRIPHNQASPSQTHRCPGVCGSRQSDQPTGIHGLCFGSCFSGPLPLNSLLHGPLSRVHFGESLVVVQYSRFSTDKNGFFITLLVHCLWLIGNTALLLVVRLYSEIDHTYLSIEAQCVSHHYPRWTATIREEFLPKY